MTRSLALLPLLLFVACGKEKPSGDVDADTDTDADTDSDTDTDAGCSEDDDCGYDQICEGTECIDGDRNNSFEEAVDVFLNQDYDGRIVPSGDVDYYKYESTGKEWLRIGTVTAEEDGGVDTVLSVYASNGALHARIDEFATGNVSSYDSLLHVYLPTAGTWYFGVEDVNDAGGTSFDYTLNVQEFTGVTSETDAFDAPRIALEPTSGSTVYSVGIVLEEPGDSDWMSIAMPYGQAPIEVWGLPEIPGSDATPLTALWTSTSEKISEKEGIGPDGIQSYFDAEKSDYVLQATDAFGGGGEAHWYVVYVRTRDEGYGNPREVELNDDASSAQVFEVETLVSDSGQTYDRAFIQGALIADGDEDWFAMDAYPGGSLSFSCGGETYGALADLAIDVIAPDGTTVVHTQEDGDDSTPDLDELTSLVEGTHYLRVYSQDGVGYGLGAYYRCGFYMYE